MNTYDATRMIDVMAAEGFEETGTMEDADLIILNTCHIRERASEKIFSELGKIRVLKDDQAARGRSVMVGVAGCVAQAEGKEIFRRQKTVDLVVGPQSYHHLAALVEQAKSTPGVTDTEFPLEDKFDHLAAPSEDKTRSRGISAFVTVQEGCDKFCTFCVVPYTRGAEVSRPAAKIINEIRGLVEAGVREVTFLGQNVNGYHGEGLNGEALTFAQLLEEVAKIPDLPRIRYMTSHPNDMDDDLFRVHADIPAVMPFLHLPVQSGSDRILAKMNRGHTAAFYLELIEKTRIARPDIALSSDFIVGFPGETEEDFQATLDLIQRVNFAMTYFFKYSPRPGTPASDMADQVSEEIKSERLARLQALVDEQRHAYNRSKIGQALDVLFEKAGRYEGQIAGKTPYWQAVQVNGPKSLIGSSAKVMITDVRGNSLFGQLIQPIGVAE